VGDVLNREENTSPGMTWKWSTSWRVAWWRRSGTVVEYSISMENQDRSIVVLESDLSNFSANVIHEMHDLSNSTTA
jgi:hypothetical protein